MVSVFILSNNSLDIKIFFVNEKVLEKKIKYFQNFLTSKSNINLILGSGLAEDSIIPDSIGANWFSFTSARQNMKNSFEILSHYAEVIKVDTLILCLQPFDFSYKDDKTLELGLPYQDRDLNFYYGNEKIDISKRNIQKIIDSFNPFNSKKSRLQSNNLFYDVRSMQGFSGRKYKNIKNVDSLHKNQTHEQRKVYSYFYNVKKNPNMDYFDAFKNLSDSLNIKVVYLITPKSVYYRLDMKKYNYDKIWNNILDSLGSREVEIWDYENMIKGTSNINWLVDDVHFFHNGAKLFTKIISDRLKE